MGLFKNVLIGTGIGGAFGAVLGGAKTVLDDQGRAVPQIDPGTQKLRGDITDIRDTRDRDITGVRDQAQIQLNTLGADKGRALESIKQQNEGLFETAQDQQALFGGRQAGSAERISADQERSAGLFNQGIEANANSLENKIKATDLGSQLAIKNQALFATPTVEAIPLGLEQQAIAANMQGQASASGGGTNLGGLLSTGAGIFGAMSGGGGGMTGDATGVDPTLNNVNPAVGGQTMSPGIGI